MKLYYYSCYDDFSNSLTILQQLKADNDEIHVKDVFDILKHSSTTKLPGKVMYGIISEEVSSSDIFDVVYGWKEKDFSPIPLLNSEHCITYPYVIFIADPYPLYYLFRTKEKSPVTRSDILDKAKTIVNGKRQDDYGSPEDSFEKISGCWSWYINSKYKGKDISLTAEDAANMMVLFKIARNTGHSKLDNYVDICGYGAIGGELLNAKDSN